MSGAPAPDLFDMAAAGTAAVVAEAEEQRGIFQIPLLQPGGVIVEAPLHAVAFDRIPVQWKPIAQQP